MLSQFFRPLPQTHPLLVRLQRLRVGIKEPHGKGAQGGSRVSKAVRHTVPRVADAQSGSQRDAVGYAASRLSGLLVAFYSANQKALKRETYDSQVHLRFQLSDKSRVIPWVALDLLSEACDDKMNLEAVICALKAEDGRDGLESLGVKGTLLKTQVRMSFQ